jgi:ATP-dependent Lon protease
MWGKLAQCLMDAKCMNPVIYFDELDKVSETMQGQEIIGILTHLVDFTQNDKIRDRYFNGIDLDFSRCIFIFSFNDANAINAILMDRIQIFHTTGFTDDEKVTISLDYLLPEIIQNFSIGTSDVIVPRDIIMYILKKYAKQQEGVRDIKKILELLLLHLNYQYLTCSSDESSTDIKMPFTMTTSFVDKCLSRLAGQKDTFQNIYM